MEALYPAPYTWNSNWLMQQNKSTTRWTKEENKQFESALAMFDEKTPDRWLKVAAMIPGKSVSDVINQYMALVADVTDIEAGLVPDPGYLASSFTLELTDDRGFDMFRKRGRSSDQERKKGVPWTEEEHRRFLLGLLKYGKGDWRNISRNFVISKTPTQVASHAQKYYLRQQISGGKDKRRPSIHDITTGHVTNINPATDNEKSASVDDCIKPKADHKYIGTPQIVVDWKHSSDHNTSMVLDTPRGNRFTAFLNDTATRQCYRSDIGFSSSVYQM